MRHSCSTTRVLGLIAAFFGFGPIGWPLCILLGICIYLDGRTARKRRR